MRDHGPQEHGDIRADRSDRLQSVICACQQRRAAREQLSDEAIIAEHPDLMPELGQALLKLAVIQQARGRAEHSETAKFATLTDEEEMILPSESFQNYQIIRELHRRGLRHARQGPPPQRCRSFVPSSRGRLN